MGHSLVLAGLTARVHAAEGKWTRAVAFGSLLVSDATGGVSDIDAGDLTVVEVESVVLVDGADLAVVVGVFTPEDWVVVIRIPFLTVKSKRPFATK